MGDYLQSKGLTPWKRILVVVIFPLLVFGANLRATWIEDDYYQVENNPFIQSVDHIPHILTHHVWATTSWPERDSGIYRPMAFLSYMLDQYIFGVSPFGFHLVNNLLHALNVLLLYLLAARFFSLNIAMGTALLFAVHPLVVEPVSWVACRMDLLVTFFSLLNVHLLWAILATSRGVTRWAFYGLFSLTIPLGLYSKENFLLLPLGVWLSFLAHRKSLRIRKTDAGLSLAIILCLTAASLLWRNQVVGGNESSLLAAESFKNIFVFVPRFSEIIFAPWRIDPFHLVGSVNIAAIVFTVGLLALCLIFLGRKRSDVGLWIGSAIAVASAVPAVLILDLVSFFPERYFYLPWLGVSLVCGSMALFVKGSLTEKWVRWGGRFSLGLLVVLSMYTFQRTLEWKDGPALYAAAIARNGNNAIPYYYLARHYQREGNQGEVLANCREVVRRNRNHAWCANVVAVLYVGKGEFVKAREYLRLAYQADPSRSQTSYNVGYYYELKGENDRARGWYLQALKLDPDHGNAQQALSRVGGE